MKKPSQQPGDSAPPVTTGPPPPPPPPRPNHKYFTPSPESTPSPPPVTTTGPPPPSPPAPGLPIHIHFTSSPETTPSPPPVTTTGPPPPSPPPTGSVCTIASTATTPDGGGDEEEEDLDDDEDEEAELEEADDDDEEVGDEEADDDDEEDEEVGDEEADDDDEEDEEVEDIVQAAVKSVITTFTYIRPVCLELRDGEEERLLLERELARARLERAKGEDGAEAEIAAIKVNLIELMQKLVPLKKKFSDLVSQLSKAIIVIQNAHDLRALSLISNQLDKKRELTFRLTKINRNYDPVGLERVSTECGIPLPLRGQKMMRKVNEDSSIGYTWGAVESGNQIRGAVESGNQISAARGKLPSERQGFRAVVFLCDAISDRVIELSIHERKLYTWRRRRMQGKRDPAHVDEKLALYNQEVLKLQKEIDGLREEILGRLGKLPKDTVFTIKTRHELKALRMIIDLLGEGETISYKLSLAILKRESRALKKVNRSCKFIIPKSETDIVKCKLVDGKLVRIK